MGKKKIEPDLTPDEWNDVYLHMALYKMEHQPNGMAAALVCCEVLGIKLPDWVRDRLAAEQLETTISMKRRRQKKTVIEMEQFKKDALRYFCVTCTDEERTKATQEERRLMKRDKFDQTFEMIKHLGPFATDHPEGLEKSYYAFQHAFGGPRLASYIAERVASSIIKMSIVADTQA